jgi:uncharacterized protein
MPPVALLATLPTAGSIAGSIVGSLPGSLAGSSVLAAIPTGSLTTALLLVVFGLAIGISLGSVGAGGSILAVPVLVYVAGEEPKQATVSALIVVLTTSLIALRPHWTARRVRTDLAIPFAVAGTAGAFIGKRLADGIDADLLMLAFAGLMIVSGTWSGSTHQRALASPRLRLP